MTRYYGRILHPEFTDLAVVIGPNARWVEDDYEDLQRSRPEVLLGYRVKLLTPWDINRNGLKRWMPVKIIVLHGSEETIQWHNVRNELKAYLENFEWARVEYWHVHRVKGVWQFSPGLCLDSIPKIGQY